MTNLIRKITWCHSSSALTKIKLNMLWKKYMKAFASINSKAVLSGKILRVGYYWLTMKVNV